MVSCEGVVARSCSALELPVSSSVKGGKGWQLCTWAAAQPRHVLSGFVP